jgi:RNA polymerase sigma-70 factor (ECF subfamily)
MPCAMSQEITQLLLAWTQGDRQALNRLMPLVHGELHRLAHRYMAGERPGHPLQTSALVNEAYLRLIDTSRVRWQNRAHFFAVSAQLMRRILVDVARGRAKLKRGGGAIQVSLDHAMGMSREPGPDVIALDDALTMLAAFDQRKSQVVELRFFGGLSVGETAEVLGVSAMTVMRDWALAKAWLLRKLEKSE